MPKVKIIKVKYSTLWYNQFIGDIFEVEEYQKQDHKGEQYWVIKNYNISKLKIKLDISPISSDLLINIEDTIDFDRKEKLNKIISKINDNR